MLRWIDREARAEDSDKIRCYVQHAKFRRVLRRSGYFVVKSDLLLNAKVNAVQVPSDFMRTSTAGISLWATASWIIRRGDMTLEQKITGDIALAMKARISNS